MVSVNFLFSADLLYHRFHRIYRVTSTEVIRDCTPPTVRSRDIVCRITGRSMSAQQRHFTPFRLPPRFATSLPICFCAASRQVTPSAKQVITDYTVSVSGSTKINIRDHEICRHIKQQHRTVLNVSRHRYHGMSPSRPIIRAAIAH